MSSAVSQAERASILESLSSADEEVRRLAVEQLLILPIEEAADQLYECLGDTGWRVRKAAVERLVVCGGQAAVQEMLVASLADGENPGRRNSAFEALVGCGPRATARLITEMSSADADVRKLVIDALAAIGDPIAREHLIEAIDDPDANIRAAAVEAIGGIGGAQEIERLIEIASGPDEDVLVRLSALRALSRMEAVVEVSSLTDALADSLLRPAAFDLLGNSPDSGAHDTLLKGLSAKGRSSRESAMGALLRCLGRIDDVEDLALRSRIRAVATATDGLIQECCQRLQTADLSLQMVLIQFLGMVEDSCVVLPILETGRDEAIAEVAAATLEPMGDRVPEALAPVWDDLDHVLRGRACSILGRIGGGCAERLLALCLDSNDGQLRCCAARAIGEGGFIGRVPDLVRCLESAAGNDDFESDDEVDTLVAAIVCLAERREATRAGFEFELVEVLSSRFEGAPEPLRLAFAQVLSRLGREQDADVIGLLLKDESAAVRRAAVGALSGYGFETTRDLLRIALADEATVVRIEAARVLGISGQSEAVRELRPMIEDEDPKVVAVAVRSLGRLFDAAGAERDEIFESVRAALESGPIVALAGFDALREMGGECASILAREGLLHPEADVVRAAVACLGAHGMEDDLIELLPFAGHVEWSVRAEVAEVLSARGVRKGLPTLLRRLEVEDDAFVRQVILRAIGRLEG